MLSVSAAIEQIRTMTDEVTTGYSKVQELAMQSSEEAQSTSAATEQQLAANEDISSAQVLAELSEKLQNDMGRFKPCNTLTGNNKLIAMCNQLVLYLRRDKKLVHFISYTGFNFI